MVMILVKIVFLMQKCFNKAFLIKFSFRPKIYLGHVNARNRVFIIEIS